MASQSMGAVSSSVPRCWSHRRWWSHRLSYSLPAHRQWHRRRRSPSGRSVSLADGHRNCRANAAFVRSAGPVRLWFLAHAPATACGGCTVMTEDICTGRAGWPWLTKTFSSQSFLPCQHAHAFTMTVNTPRVIVTRSSHCSCPIHVAVGQCHRERGGVRERR